MLLACSIPLQESRFEARGAALERERGGMHAGCRNVREREGLKGLPPVPTNASRHGKAFEKCGRGTRRPK